MTETGEHPTKENDMNQPTELEYTLAPGWREITITVSGDEITNSAPMSFLVPPPEEGFIRGPLSHELSRATLFRNELGFYLEVVDGCVVGMDSETSHEKHIKLGPNSPWIVQGQA